ncbi:hypothetical protein BD560DRAFT_401671 [Blakeslea trispora]|nr:hypothetical protein BD560DRAFT_401671 [Blakeslea trispora]
MTQLFASIRAQCFLQGQRRLSIRGRATVLNSLILSQLSHVFRLLPLTKSYFQALDSLCSKFLNEGHRISPSMAILSCISFLALQELLFPKPAPWLLLLVLNQGYLSTIL